MPVRNGQLIFVTPEPGGPVWSAAIKLGAAGAAGAVVSIVRAKAALAALTLRAASVAVAVTE